MLSKTRLLPIEIVDKYLQDPPTNLTSMAEELGVDVTYSDSLGNDVAGKIERCGERYVISINSHDNPRRQRFTLAHEISHFLLHRNLIGDGIKDVGLYRSRLSNETEQQANACAANFLMPKLIVEREYKAGCNTANLLANRFDVSPHSARIRMKSLGLEEK